MAGKVGWLARWGEGQGSWREMDLWSKVCSRLKLEARTYGLHKILDQLCRIFDFTMFT